MSSTEQNKCDPFSQGAYSHRWVHKGLGIVIQE